MFTRQSQLQRASSLAFHIMDICIPIITPLNNFVLSFLFLFHLFHPLPYNLILDCPYKPPFLWNTESKLRRNPCYWISTSTTTIVFTRTNASRSILFGPPSRTLASTLSRVCTCDTHLGLIVMVVTLVVRTRTVHIVFSINDTSIITATCLDQVCQGVVIMGWYHHEDSGLASIQ